METIVENKLGRIVLDSTPYDPVETARCLVACMICVYINFACAYVIESKLPVLYMVRSVKSQTGDEAPKQTKSSYSKELKHRWWCDIDT